MISLGLSKSLVAHQNRTLIKTFRCHCATDLQKRASNLSPSVVRITSSYIKKLLPATKTIKSFAFGWSMYKAIVSYVTWRNWSNRFGSDCLPFLVVLCMQIQKQFPIVQGFSTGGKYTDAEVTMLCFFSYSAGEQTKNRT